MEKITNGKEPNWKDLVDKIWDLAHNHHPKAREASKDAIIYLAELADKWIEHVRDCKDFEIRIHTNSKNN